MPGTGDIETIDNENLLAIKKIMLKNSDLPMEFADASLVYLGDKLNY
ncbi:MAG: hypothetical protein JKY19_08575 [Alcanivoracaceae bacterium]|nr:hypothetical protein [Alcanivoracaceae bacterium]